MTVEDVTVYNNGYDHAGNNCHEHGRNHVTNLDVDTHDSNHETQYHDCNRPVTYYDNSMFVQPDHRYSVLDSYY